MLDKLLAERIDRHLGLGVGDVDVLQPPRDTQRVDRRGGHGMGPAWNETLLHEICLPDRTALARSGGLSKVASGPESRPNGD